jgi:primase-polymerase (primpol)-like protein
MDSLKMPPDRLMRTRIQTQSCTPHRDCEERKERILTSQDRPAFCPDNVPVELKAIPRWVCWRSVWAKEKEKYEKIPLRPRDGRPASVTSPDDWSSFEVAAGQFTEWNGSGVGIVLSGEDDLVGLDFDNCADPLEEWVERAVRSLDTYVELSPSGKGLRGFLRGRLPGRERRRGQVEMYESGRYTLGEGEPACTILHFGQVANQ